LHLTGWSGPSLVEDAGEGRFPQPSRPPLFLAQPPAGGAFSGAEFRKGTIGPIYGLSIYGAF
jgi:hypothetical protein